MAKSRCSRWYVAQNGRLRSRPPRIRSPVLRRRCAPTAPCSVFSAVPRVRRRRAIWCRCSGGRPVPEARRACRRDSGTPRCRGSGAVLARQRWRPRLPAGFDFTGVPGDGMPKSLALGWAALTVKMLGFAPTGWPPPPSAFHHDPLASTSSTGRPSSRAPVPEHVGRGCGRAGDAGGVVGGDRQISILFSDAGRHHRPTLPIAEPVAAARRTAQFRGVCL